MNVVQVRPADVVVWTQRGFMLRTVIHPVQAWSGEVLPPAHNGNPGIVPPWLERPVHTLPIKE